MARTIFVDKGLDWDGPKGYKILDNRMNENMTEV